MKALNILILALPLLTGGCAKVSFTFTGANLPPEIKTFSIANFYNDAMDGPANLGVRFTEGLKDYFLRNTSLNRQDEGGHLEFSGRITSFAVTPDAPGGGEFQTALLQRLTITVEVEFINMVDDEKSFKQPFSFFSQFDGNTTLSAVEDGLITVIFEQIIFDIFNKTVADW